MAVYDNEPTMMGGSRPTASLVVRQGTQAGMSFPISGSQATIGREEGIEIVLQDPEASRRHSRISWQGGSFVVEDLGSTNGTFVNGVQIVGPQILNPGDSIGIGQTILVFQVASPPAGTSYQAGQPVQSPAYTPPVAAGKDGRVTQYLLYGCGCLLLICICSLLAVATWALLSPQTFEDATGINISWQMISTFLNLA